MAQHFLLVYVGTLTHVGTRDMLAVHSSLVWCTQRLESGLDPSAQDLGCVHTTDYHRQTRIHVGINQVKTYKQHHAKVAKLKGLYLDSHVTAYSQELPVLDARVG